MALTAKLRAFYYKHAAAVSKQRTFACNLLETERLHAKGKSTQDLERLANDVFGERSEGLEHCI